MVESVLDALVIVLVSICANLVSEGISWFFVYRTDSFKQSKVRLDELNKRLEKEEATLVGLEKRKVQEKKIERYNEDIKNATSQLNGSRFKVNIGISLLLMIVYRLISFQYYGKAVATLPFEPIPYLRGMTHRGLEGENFRECSFAFIYAMCTMALKGTMQKALGHAAPRNTYDYMKNMEKDSMLSRKY
mmetsp:Transcript_37229/g.148588  ORF Transcript_37229/g.148588 Transcript_37229/m.148588 type:complete len:189 (-) Transcript_37229:538-1104(-)|eukprot:CAMPEP_0113954436 /NCGR_PEP_ID=MMETSP0011_2-20120614/540_1 /TAXON_ID=101924 /ORGANISM="Rhodosorus marinus" /LENGTH=188 /DNA_ID=CAMNT_0000963541 /DNA_START=175 /DNA_END=741 /DNA_ORIENTATION=- /assembly_acc=CAM_ASM_000156